MEDNYPASEILRRVTSSAERTDKRGEADTIFAYPNLATSLWASNVCVKLALAYIDRALKRTVSRLCSSRVSSTSNVIQ
jgi:hypothetical protein